MAKVIPQTQWHGSAADAGRLQTILTDNCACVSLMGKRGLCPGHDAMVHDQKFLDYLNWNRWQRAELIRQEWATKT